MAVPLTNEQVTKLVASSWPAKRARLYDNFFKSSPLIVRLNTKNKVKQKGGRNIQTPFIYAGLGGGSYGRGDTFDTSDKEFFTHLELPWKFNYVPVTLFGMDLAMNEGAAKVLDLFDSHVRGAELTMFENMAKQMFGNGQGNTAKDLDGLRVAVDDTLAYGGITRDTSPQGTAIKAHVDSTGGAFSLSMVQAAYGKVTFGTIQPDLIVTTQAIFDKFWERVQPSQRWGNEDLKKIGMRSCQFNAADVVVDQYCPAETIYLLNTEFLEFWCLGGKDFVFRLGGGVPIFNKDAITDQLISYSNFVCPSPRYQARIDSVT